MKFPSRFQIIICLFCIGILSCSSSPQNEERNNQSSIPPEGVEEPYNATPITIVGNATQISALAQFQRYIDTNGSLQLLPIRFAEFWILNASGVVVQRGETDHNGNIQTQIPRVAGDYTIQVRSRAFNSYYKASILDSPYSKTVYSVSSTFSLNGNEISYPSTIQILALAGQNTNIVGGAFNILHNIYLANTFLSSSLNPAPNIPKVQVYWKKGVTPATYFGGTGAISFYVPQSSNGLYKGLYILGGESSTVCVDTDHFDNSVILHEYAHFLEHQLSRSDSPGGSHNGTRIIDPRLAWSEGFANYFQGVVLGRDNYRDTSAIGCSNQNLSQILFDLVKRSTTTNDIPTKYGEGNFREMAIARYLYAITSNHTISGNISYSGLGQSFQLLWNSFLGLANSALTGRGIHHFNRHFVSNQSSPSNFKSTGSPFEIEKQNDTLNDWARPLVISNQPCAQESGLIDANGFFSIAYNTPKPDRGVSGADLSCGHNSAIAWSDMLNSNDFYVLNLNPTRSEQIWIEYGAGGSGTPFDLDLYLYRERFTFLNSADIARSSERFYPEENGQGIERVSLNGLPVGRYFLNLKIDQPSCARQTTYYRIRIGNKYLCPNSNLNAN